VLNLFSPEPISQDLSILKQSTQVEPIGIVTESEAELKAKAKKPRKNYEFDKVQVPFVHWVRDNWDVVVISSNDGTAMAPWAAVQNKRVQSGKGQPDVSIYAGMRGHFGLFLELKKDINEYLTKAGKIRLDKKRTIPQLKRILKLREWGYCAYFAGGLDEAEAITLWYMSGEPTRGQDREWFLKDENIYWDGLKGAVEVKKESFEDFLG
jgi:hypothetical protein